MPIQMSQRGNLLLKLFTRLTHPPLQLELIQCQKWSLSKMLHHDLCPESRKQGHARAISQCKDAKLRSENKRVFVGRIRMLAFWTG
jgi:hypothetical protein